MMNHMKVYRKVALKDLEWQADMLAADQEFPKTCGMFADPLEIGVYASCYLGWYLAKHGAAKLRRQFVLWRAL